MVSICRLFHRVFVECDQSAFPDTAFHPGLLPAHANTHTEPLNGLSFSDYLLCFPAGSARIDPFSEDAL